jgi:sortase A
MTTTTEPTPATTESAPGWLDVRSNGRHRVKTEPAAAPEWTRPVTFVLVVVAALAAWLLLFLGPLSALRESHAQSTLYATFRGQLASGEHPPPPFAPGSVLREGDPVAVLSIPSIGITRMVVVEGTRSKDLELGPGHLPGSVLPGEAGVSGIYGRAFGYGGPFRKIHQLLPGATIDVTTGQGHSTYTVVDARGPGQPIPGKLGVSRGVLTLVTAANNGWHNLWVPTHAIYVDATITGTPGADATSTQPVTADLAMKSDTSNLVVLVLWLQLLFVAVLGLVWAATRWSRRQVWTVGVPIVVAVLWGVSLQFTQLLPNLL